MAKLSLDIPSSLYDMLKATFLKTEDNIAGFAAAAMQEYGTWLGGQDRPSTMSELETKRIYFVYENILKDRVPTIEEIGDRFNLPLGRSRYIVQNLNYRYPIFMRQRKKSAIISVLNAFQRNAQGTQSITCPKEISDVLDEAIAELHSVGMLKAMPTRTYYPFTVVYEMVEKDRQSILTQVKKI